MRRYPLTHCKKHWSTKQGCFLGKRNMAPKLSHTITLKPSSNLGESAQAAGSGLEAEGANGYALPSPKQEALNISQKFLRKLLVDGRKDCCWCERHLKCRFERQFYKALGFYCNFWQLSRILRAELHITFCEVSE